MKFDRRATHGADRHDRDAARRVHRRQRPPRDLGRPARMTRDDLLFIVLIGHGTFDGVDAKFNLVGAGSGVGASGPRSSTAFPAGSWSSTHRRPAFRSSSASPASAAIVITATDSVAQRFDTVFPDYFIKALADDAADLDKNGRISIWEAFAAASGGVRRHYQQRGQLATERALLDDNGDGVGRDAGGSRRRRLAGEPTYLDEPLPARADRRGAAEAPAEARGARGGARRAEGPPQLPAAAASTRRSSSA